MGLTASTTFRPERSVRGHSRVGTRVMRGRWSHQHHQVHGTHPTPLHPHQVAALGWFPGTFCPGHAQRAQRERGGRPLSQQAAGLGIMRLCSHCAPLCSTHHSGRQGRGGRHTPAALTHYQTVLHQFPHSRGTWGSRVCVGASAAGGSLPGPVRAGRGRQGSQATAATTEREHRRPRGITAP